MLPPILPPIQWKRTSPSVSGLKRQPPRSRMAASQFICRIVKGSIPSAPPSFSIFNRMAATFSFTSRGPDFNNQQKQE